MLVPIYYCVCVLATT